MTESLRTIPALINAASGSADAAREALASNSGFDVREVQPDKLEASFKDAASEGPARILVAGGDGTIASAATVLLGTGIALAVLPGGTLNHFARDLGIPTDPKDAIAVALGGTSRDVDVGVVSGHVFLNTSSVGAYVHFVRIREYLEPRFGYGFSSFIAACRILADFRIITVELEVGGHKQVYRTPLVFIGVSERELQLPTLGSRVEHGRRGLHVMVVRGRSRARLMAIALNAVARGVKSVARTPELDSFIVDRCTISQRYSGTVAIDGELVRLGAPLEYELRREGLRVVCP